LQRVHPPGAERIKPVFDHFPRAFIPLAAPHRGLAVLVCYRQTPQTHNYRGKTVKDLSLNRVYPRFVVNTYIRQLRGLTMAQAKTTTGGPTNEHNNPRGIYRGTREEWLEAAMRIMSVWINTVIAQPRLNGKRQPVRGSISIAKDYAKKLGTKAAQYKFKLSEVRVSCSLLGGGLTDNNALAHCDYKQRTGNNYHEIRMGAHVGGRATRESSRRVADILLHEMVHTCWLGHGHRGGFRDTCHALGLLAPMTSTRPNAALSERIDNEVVKVLGRYPHKGIKLMARGTRGKGSRLKLCECPGCGCKVRLTRVWIDKAYTDMGYVSCPVCCDSMEVNN